MAWGRAIGLHPSQLALVECSSGESFFFFSGEFSAAFGLRKLILYEFPMIQPTLLLNCDM